MLAEIQTPPIVTTDFLYLRFIGNRTIDPKDFGRIQKDRVPELEYWSELKSKGRREDEVCEWLRTTIMLALGLQRRMRSGR